MGHRFNMDGKCYYCKKDTDIFCDACGRWICPKHTVLREVDLSMEEYKICPECAKLNKKTLHQKKGEMLRPEGIISNTF